MLPFDKSAPIGSEILPGGHLARQREQFEKLRAEGRVSPDASLIWWNPVSSEMLTEAPLADADDSFLKEIDSLPEPQKRTCSEEELSADLLDRLQTEVVTAKVWIDWVEKDNQTIEQAKKEVKARFNAYCQRRAAGSVPFTPKLKFLTADWQKLAFKLGKRKKPDGVVIVYNEYKDFEALEAESEVISEDPEVLHHRMLPGIFYLHPNGMYKPDDDWIFVRFLRKNSELSYDPDELEQFVAGLFRVIAKKHPHLVLGGQA